MMAAAFTAMPGFAQNLLDEQLGPKPGGTTIEPPTAGPAPVVKEEPKPAPAVKSPQPRAPEIVSPEAAKRVDDLDLIRELTDPGSDQPNPQKVEERVKAMLARMSDSAELLRGKKDPGDLTQETQRRIVMDLDVMIQLAQQQQQNSSSNSQQPQQPGQQRQPGQQPGQQQPGQQQGGSTAATDDETKPGQSAAHTGDMRNRDAENWGGLPPRDRDEISHGANEEYLPAYRAMIDRYYQALAEMGRKNRR
jgi:hypothetical protein